MTSDASGNATWGVVSSEDSVKVLSKAANYTITSGSGGDVEDVGTLYVLVDASAATRTITLPAPADYNGVVIKVVASVAPGTGYSVIVNNSGGSEIWTCYAIGDHYTGISDGTSNIKVDGKVTVYGKMYRSDNQTSASNAFVKILFDNLEYDSGGWGNITDDRIDVAFDCIINVELYVNVENTGYPTVYVDGSNRMAMWNATYEDPLSRSISFVKKVTAAQTPIELYYYTDYGSTRTMRGGQYSIYTTWKVLERL